MFIWFGALKLFGEPSAADLVAATVYVVSPGVIVPIRGAWEVIIRAGLLIRVLIRLGSLLVVLQLPGTFLPLTIFPSVVSTEFHMDG